MEEINTLMTKCNLRHQKIPYPESSIILGKMGASIAKPIADDLKEHQIQGIRFMYHNICSDFEGQKIDKEPSGCILVRLCILILIPICVYFTHLLCVELFAKAHCMGLGIIIF
jgi:hypothetical protein